MIRQVRITKWSIAVVWGVIALLLAACDSSDNAAPQQDMVFSSQYPEGQSIQLNLEGFNEPADVVIKNDKAFLGDILVGEVKEGNLVMAGGQVVPYAKDGLTTQGTGILSSSGQKWPGGVIPYVFDANLPQATRTKFLQAKADYDAKTAVRFVPRTNQRDYVRVINDDACYSFIGKIGGAQALSLGNGCSVNAARHEMGHALGLQHEQNRRDRDRWVIVNAGGSQNEIDYGSAGNPIGAYDFQSMMHYRNYYRNGRWDYVPKTGFPPERVGNDEVNTFTSGDLGAIASIYGGNSGGGGGGGGGGDQEATVCFFFDINYGGKQLCVNGIGDIDYIGNEWNDQISSVKVTPGYIVTMYFDRDLGGGGYYTSGNQADFRSFEFNDELSSLKVRRN